MGAGLAEATGIDRHLRLAEALTYFASELGLAPFVFDNPYLEH